MKSRPFASSQAVRIDEDGLIWVRTPTGPWTVYMQQEFVPVQDGYMSCQSTITFADGRHGNGVVIVSAN